MAACYAVVSAQPNVPTEVPGTLGEEVAVGKADQLAGQLTLRDSEAQLRSDAGRLAGGKRYARERGTQSLYST